MFAKVSLRIVAGVLALGVSPLFSQSAWAVDRDANGDGYIYADDSELSNPRDDLDVILDFLEDFGYTTQAGNPTLYAQYIKLDVDGNYNISNFDYLNVANHLNTTPWQKDGSLPTPTDARYDVNGDNYVTQQDLLVLYNRMNSIGSGPFTLAEESSNNNWDVDGNNFFSPLDINALYTRLNGG